MTTITLCNTEMIKRSWKLFDAKHETHEGKYGASSIGGGMVPVSGEGL